MPPALPVLGLTRIYRRHRASLGLHSSFYLLLTRTLDHGHRFNHSIKLRFEGSEMGQLEGATTYYHQNTQSICGDLVSNAIL